MKIEVKRIHVFDGEGKVKASADIVIGGLVTINGCSVVEGKEGKFFLGLPQKKDKQQEGKYWPIVTLEDRVYKTTSSVVINEYLNKVNGGGSSNGSEAVAWEE